MEKYTINLVAGKNKIKSYTSSIIPSVGDGILLEEDKVFKVENRFLPSNENLVIALNGIIVIATKL
jgi:hypothetical protein